MINSYAVGYPMYRDGFAPAVARNVYSTVNQASIWTLTLEQNDRRSGSEQYERL